MTEDDVPVQYLIHPAFRPRLDAWLDSQGMRVDLVPDLQREEDDLPVYLVALKEFPR